MRKGMVFFLLLAFVVGLAGCQSLIKTPVRPPQGWIYTKVRAPLTVNCHGTKTAGNKVGVATTTFLSIPLYYVSLDFAWDDCDVKKAADQGGITTVYYADYELEQVLGIFGRFTVRVYGE